MRVSKKSKREFISRVIVNLSVPIFRNWQILSPLKKIFFIKTN